MNEIVNPKAADEVPAPTALVTIDPKSYVEAVYSTFEQRLKDAVASTEGVTYDVTTKDGMAVAKAGRSLFKGIRIDTEKERAARKAPILEIGKLLDSRAKEIEAQVRPLEEKYDADIKAEEQRIEEEKAAKLKAEAERQAALQAKIDAIKGAPLEALNMSAFDTQALIDRLELQNPTEEEFGERYVEAEIALETAKVQLKTMIEGKRAQEELARQARIQEEERAAAEAKAKAEREAEEARQREAQAAEAARLKAEREEFERQKAEFRQQQEEAERKKREAAEAEERKQAEARAAAEKQAAEEQAQLKAAAEAEVHVVEPAAPLGAGHPDYKAAQETLNSAAATQAEVVASVHTLRRERPSDEQIIGVLALHYRVHEAIVVAWLLDMDLNAAGESVAANM